MKGQIADGMIEARNLEQKPGEQGHSKLKVIYVDII
jgi:hypothetical protein